VSLQRVMIVDWFRKSRVISAPQGSFDSFQYTEMSVADDKLRCNEAQSSRSVVRSGPAHCHCLAPNVIGIVGVFTSPLLAYALCGQFASPLSSPVVL
jgi:hypothetical protein